MSGIQDIYEKMLQDPANRKKSIIKQPTPYDEMKMQDPDLTGEQAIAPEELDFLSEVDKRMQRRLEGKPNTQEKQIGVSEDRINKLETQIKELQELVTTIMKTQMKLLA